MSGHAMIIQILFFSQSSIHIQQGLVPIEVNLSLSPMQVVDWGPIIGW